MTIGAFGPDRLEPVVSALTPHAVRDLVRRYPPPCVSLYQQTHRHYPDNRQDPIRFKNLVRRADASLRQRYPDVSDLLAPFRALGEDAAFWNHTLDGLAVLGARGLFRVFLVQRPVRELVVVADTLHLKPLLRVGKPGRTACQTID